MPCSVGRRLWGRRQRSPGQAVSELSQLGFFGLGGDAVGYGVGDVELPALFEGEVDGGAVPVGPAGYLG